MRKQLIAVCAIVIYSLFVAPVEAVNYKLPWESGQSWGYWQGWHSDFGGGVDVGTTSINRSVLAAADGRVESVQKCGLSGAVHIISNDGVTMKYYHLDKDTIPESIREGSILTQGRYLGDVKPGTWNDGNCGYTEQNDVSSHLHWVIPISGLVVEGWSLTASNDGNNANDYWTKGTTQVYQSYGTTPFLSTNVRNDGVSTACGIADVYLLGEDFGDFEFLNCLGISTLTAVNTNIHHTGQVNLVAGNTVTLGDGFRANPNTGGSFTAKIGTSL